MRFPQSCNSEYKSKPEDRLILQYESFTADGDRFNTSAGSEPLAVVWGRGELQDHWEEALKGRCVGEQVAMVVTEEDGESLYYILEIGVISRVERVAPSSGEHWGILARRAGACPDSTRVRVGSRVSMNTTARIPNCKENL